MNGNDNLFRQYVTDIFTNVRQSQETQDIMEEIILNLNERYAELVADGVDEREAYDLTIESLGDPDELVKSLGGNGFRTTVNLTSATGTNTNINSSNSNTQEGYVSFSKDSVCAIDASLMTEDITISTYGEKDVSVRVFSKNKGYMPNIFVENGTLFIKRENFWNNIFFTKRISAQIKVFVPAEQLLDINVSTVSGDIKLEVRKSKEVALNTASGDINSTGDFDLIKVQTASGDIDVKGTGEIAHLETASGDIEATGTIKALELQTASGDIEASGDFTVAKLNTASGDIELAGKVLEEIKAHTASGDIEISLKNMPVNGAKLKAVSGDQTIKLPQNDGFMLDYSTLSGSVRNAFTGQKYRHSGTASFGSGSPTFKASSVSGDIVVRS